MKNAKAVAIRTGQVSSIPSHLRESHAVAGQSDSPENNANQPLVGGQGPRVISSSNPPPPARSAQPHASKFHTSGKYRATLSVRIALSLGFVE
jgi:hypothetical protein